MSNTEIISKIKSWRNVANDYEDYFIKFALEYFVFNALLRITYFPNRDGVKDRGLINRLKQDSELYSPKKFDFKYLQTTNGLRQTNREEGKVHRATQEKRKEQQRDSV